MSLLTPTSVLLFVGLFANYYCRSLALVISQTKADSFDKATGEDIPWKSKNTLDGGTLNITCGGKNVAIPRQGVVLRNPANGKMAMWCPNAKIGTSTMSALIATILLEKTVKEYNELSGGHSFMRGGVEKITDYVKKGTEQQLCNMEMSFTFIRNPWDRLISTYLDKVATRKLLVPGFYNATFPQFLYALTEVDPQQMNAHFTPVSTRCFTGIANYTHVYKIEDDFEQSIVDIFRSLGVSSERTLSMLRLLGAQNQNSQHHRGLQYRQEMFHQNQALVNVVARLYADDIAFGGYAFDKTD